MTPEVKAALDAYEAKDAALTTADGNLATAHQKVVDDTARLAASQAAESTAKTDDDNAASERDAAVDTLVAALLATKRTPTP